MNPTIKLLFIFIFLFLLNPIALAGWDPKCLSDCFATGHECKYCSYQCFSEDYLNRIPYIPPSDCPLVSYYRSLD